MSIGYLGSPSEVNYYLMVLSIIADCVSIVGFILTGFVLWNVGSLKKYYGLKGRFPQLMKDIRKHSADLSALLNSNVLDVEEAQVTLRRCQSSMKSLLRFSPRECAKSVKQAEKALKKSIAVRNSRAAIRESYEILTTVEADFKNLRLDEKWRPPQ